MRHLSNGSILLGAQRSAAKASGVKARDTGGLEERALEVALSEQELAGIDAALKPPRRKTPLEML
ncbi:MAG: hypothetical protein EPN57_02435 [Paraburkholderia sp.]|nr:MAG: hypothetical protein EPN57_02435 [Paraburkholderia sp.]